MAVEGINGFLVQALGLSKYAISEINLLKVLLNTDCVISANDRLRYEDSDVEGQYLHRIPRSKFH